MTLGAEVINLIEFQVVQHFHQAHRIAQIAIVQEQFDAPRMAVLVEVSMRLLLKLLARRMMPWTS